jgi:hypothetical protein
MKKSKVDRKNRKQMVVVSDCCGERTYLCDDKQCRLVSDCSFVDYCAPVSCCC